MAQHFGGRDGDQSGHEPRGHGARLRPSDIEPDDEEADRYVQELARYLMLVHECSPMAVNGDQTERARTAAKIAPRPACDGRLGRREMAVARFARRRLAVQRLRGLLLLDLGRMLVPPGRRHAGH